MRIGLPASSIALLVLAVVNRWPYGFYTLLRLVVCASAIFLAVQAQELAKNQWAWIMGAIAILFNPMAPLLRVRPVRQLRMAEG